MRPKELKINTLISIYRWISKRILAMQEMLFKAGGLYYVVAIYNIVPDKTRNELDEVLKNQEVDMVSVRAKLLKSATH